MTAIITASSTPALDAKGRRWVRVLKQLDGDFRDDLTNQVLKCAYVLMGAFAGGMVIAAGSRVMHQAGARNWAWVFIPLGVLLLIGCAALLWTRVGARYRIGGGEIRWVLFNGHTSWSESLATLQSVSFPSGGRRGFPVIELHWLRHKRRIELYSSLLAAINAKLDDKHDEAPCSPAGESWVCAMCNESNPGNFDTCWKCGSSKP